MPRTLRDRKRAASPEEPSVEPKPKPKRGRKAAIQQPLDDNNGPTTPEPQPSSCEPAFKKDPKYENGDTQLADGQYAKAQNLIIPVDEECPLNSYQVYVDNANIIWDANLSA